MVVVSAVADDFPVAVTLMAELEVTEVRIVTVHQVGKVDRLLIAVQYFLLVTTECLIIQDHISLMDVDTAVTAMITEETVGLEVLF